MPRRTPMPPDEQMAEMYAAYFEPSLNRMYSSSSEIGIHFRRPSSESRKSTDELARSSRSANVAYRNITDSFAPFAPRAPCFPGYSGVGSIAFGSTAEVTVRRLCSTTQLDSFAVSIAENVSSTAARSKSAVYTRSLTKGSNAFQMSLKRFAERA
jgi:hypothetical protein